MRKPVHFALIILAVIVVLVLIFTGIWFFVGRESKINKGGSYSPYPYTWQRQENNQIELIVEQDAKLDYKWVARDVPGRIMTISEAIPLENNKSKVVFTITPLEFGQESFSLVYCKEGDAPDELYVFHVSILIDENNRPTITAVTGNELAGIQTLEHEVSGIYLTSVDYNNVLWIGHTNRKKGFTWLLQGIDETILEQSTNVQGEAAIMGFRGIKAGETTIKLLGKGQDENEIDVILTVPVTVDEALRLSVMPMELQEQAAPVLASEAETQKLQKMETLLGLKIKLPKEAVRRTHSSDLFTGEDEKEYQFGQISFSYGQKKWYLNLMKDATVPTMQKLLDFPDRDGTDFTIGTITGKLYQESETIKIDDVDKTIVSFETFWESEDGFSYSLSGKDITRAELDQLLSLLSDAAKE